MITSINNEMMNVELTILIMSSHILHHHKDELSMLLWAEWGLRTFAYDNRQTNSNDAVRDHSPLYPS